jgi:hypothetical protein
MNIDNSLEKLAHSTREKKSWKETHCGKGKARRNRRGNRINILVHYHAFKNIISRKMFAIAIFYLRQIRGWRGFGKDCTTTNWQKLEWMLRKLYLQITITSSTNRDGGAHKFERRTYRVGGGRRNNATCKGSSTRHINAKTSNYIICITCKQTKYHRTTCNFKFTCY